MKIDQTGKRFIHDNLILEECYRLYLDGVEMTKLYCTPNNLKQLAAGYSLSQGWPINLSQLENIYVDKENKKIFLSFNEETNFVEESQEIHLNSQDIYRLWKEFDSKSYLFRQTGAAHSCALADKNGLLYFKEDVARHNALDKVIGEMLIKGISPKDKILIFSGRLALDMMKKIVKSHIKLLIAHGAPTLAAVELAEKSNITLMGFVRQDNINVYTHWQRIRE